jgi:hypothetical protein
MTTTAMRAIAVINPDFDKNADERRFSLSHGAKPWFRLGRVEV